MTKRALLFLAAMILLFGCSVESEMAAHCEADCPLYGATFVKVSRHRDASDKSNWECWCRRGAEAGGGSEPLRIW